MTRGRGNPRPIAPFGEDLWRDIALALEHARSKPDDGYGWSPPRDRTPYVTHIRDRILEHRRAELRRLEIQLEEIGSAYYATRKLIRDRVEEIDLLREGP